MKPSVVADRSTPLWYVDVVNADGVTGWALAPGDGAARIEVRVNGRTVGNAVRGLPRPDVAAAHPDWPGAATSGFTYPFPRGTFAEASTPAAAVEVRLLGGWEPLIYTARVPVIGSTAREPAAGPFAAPVLALLQELGPAYRHADWSDALMRGAVEDIAYLVRSGSKRLKGLYPYLGYLAACLQHARIVERQFPRTNDARTPLDKDGSAVQSSGLEMGAIAHHLWVLKSHGVEGAVVEFGCFKGFSTAILSFACALLGQRLHVFDSFAGLPPSNDGYYRAGDFAGGYDEVVSNVTEFGRIDAVTFHRGFFAESVPVWKREPVACLWLDVDLASSARDALRLFPSLHVRGVVFSHECRARHFQGGAPVPVPGPVDVVQPIVDAFTASGRTPVGRFVVGDTGAFWDSIHGVPVSSREALDALEAVALSLAG